MVDNKVPEGIPIDFEDVMNLFITRMGFTIIEILNLPDGSRDFECQTTNPVGGSVTSIIRASPSNKKISKDDVEALYDRMIERSAVRAAYITTSEFSTEASDYASEKPISLIDKYKVMDSIEKRGLVNDENLIQALSRFGFGEKHVDGYEYSFGFSKNSDEVADYFNSKVKKTRFGKALDKPVKIQSRYAPVEKFRVTNFREEMTGEEYMRKVEERDYVYVNLNNLDLYYILSKRKRNTFINQFRRDSILRTIQDLPEGSKRHLIDLLDHGDMPLTQLDGKDLTILKNRDVIDVYEGKRGLSDWTDYVMALSSGINETVILIVNEITGGINMSDDYKPPDRVEKPPEQKVTEFINMPHMRGGIYDIGDYLVLKKGRNMDVETDPIVYSSKNISGLLRSIFSAEVESKGILFMPYIRCRYEKTKIRGFSKYELMYAPEFIKDEFEKQKFENEERPHKKVNRGKRPSPKIKAKKTHERDFKLIR